MLEIKYNTYEEAKLAVASIGSDYAFIHPDLKNNRDIFITAVTNPYLRVHSILQFAGEELRDNPEVVIITIKYCDLDTFQYASTRLKADKRFVMTVLELCYFDIRGSCILKYVHPSLCSDYEVVLKSVTKHNALGYASKELQKDERIVRAAVSSNGLALRYAPAFQSDHEIVKLAIKNNPRALKYASDSIKDDKDIVMFAVMNARTKSPFKYASYRLLYDRDVLLAALRGYSDISYKYIIDSQRFKFDREMFLAATFSGNMHSFEFDKNLIDENLIEAIKQNANTLKYAPDSILNNKEIILAAIESTYLAYNFASDELKKDNDVVQLYMKKGGSWNMLPESVITEELILFSLQNGQVTTLHKPIPVSRSTALLAASNCKFSCLLNQYCDDEEIMLVALKKSNFKFENVSEKLRGSRSVVRAAVKRYGYYFKFASEELRADREILTIAMKNYPQAIEYAPKEYQFDRSLVLPFPANEYAREIIRMPQWHDDIEVVSSVLLETRIYSDILWASDSIRDNEELVKTLLDLEKKNGIILVPVLMMVSERLRHKYRKDYIYGEFL